MSLEAIAAFIGLALTVIVALVTTMRGLAKIELNLREYFEKKQTEVYQLVKADIDASREMFGETVRAIKEHANLAHHRIDKSIVEHQQLALFIRDHYVEKTYFNDNLNRLEKTIDGMDEKIDRLIDRR